VPLPKNTTPAPTGPTALLEEHHRPLDPGMAAGRARSALSCPPRTTGAVRAHPELFAEAAALRLELSSRSAAQIARILAARHGITVAEQTIRDQLRRYEASRPNERWITDVQSVIVEALFGPLLLPCCSSVQFSSARPRHADHPGPGMAGRPGRWHPGRRHWSEAGRGRNGRSGPP